MVLNDMFDYLRVELFATEYVCVEITCFITKMCRDIGRFDELDQCVACSGVGSKMLNHGLPVCDHIDLFHQIFREIMDDEFVFD
jgi:hypothetical protein